MFRVEKISHGRNQRESTFCFATCFHAGFFHGLFFDPEDGGDIFLLNVGWLATDYTASYPRRWYSLI
jgi:hypothetical protein